MAGHFSAQIPGFMDKNLETLRGVLTPLKNKKVTWDRSSQSMEKHVPNHQPDTLLLNYYITINLCGNKSKYSMIQSQLTQFLTMAMASTKGRNY